MNSIDSMIKKMRDLLKTDRISYNAASDAYDVYEGFVFALVVDEARRCRAAVTFEDVHGTMANQLVFRTSPGQIYSDNNPYTHAIVKFDDAPPLEVHVGVRVQGTSGVLHECDVLVLPQAESALCRAQRIEPRGSQCVLIVECKYYSAGLGIAQARNFEGLRADIRASKELFISNIGAPNVSKYLASRKRGYERNVMPESEQARYTQAKIREAFNDYLARHAPSSIV